MVVGIGSEYGLDRVGLAVVSLLRSQSWPREQGCTLHACRAPGAELPGLLRKASWAVLIDAVCGGGEAGVPRLLAVADLANDLRGTSSHGVGVATTLALMKQLGELPLRMAIIGIEVGDRVGAVPAAWLQAGADAVRDQAIRLAACER